MLHSILRSTFIKQGAFRAAITTGLLVGLLDGVVACLQVYISRGRMPDAVFKFIASGVFGSSAFNGGMLMIVSGIIFHLVIAVLWSTLYFVITFFIRGLVKLWWISGVTYGAYVWVMMNFVVVPVSNTPDIVPTLTSLFIIIFCVGLPISFYARRYYLTLKTSELPFG
jgi:hypothetical protein